MEGRFEPLVCCPGDGCTTLVEKGERCFDHRQDRPERTRRRDQADPDQQHQGKGKQQHRGR